MSKRLIINEEEKNRIKGLYLINEEDATCQNEKFDIVEGTKTIKKQIDRNGLTEYVKGSRKTINVIKIFLNRVAIFFVYLCQNSVPC